MTKRVARLSDGKKKSTIVALFKRQVTFSLLYVINAESSGLIFVYLSSCSSFHVIVSLVVVTFETVISGKMILNQHGDKMITKWSRHNTVMFKTWQRKQKQKLPL